MMVDFSKVRALCLGDVVLDRFVSGDVTSISREAPVPVFRWGSEKVMLGGVGNVVANLRALGVETTLIARIGRDSAGARIRDLLDQAGANHRLIESGSIPTIQKTRFVAKGHHVLKVDQDGERTPSAAEEDEVLAALKAALPQIDLVILSDYANGLLSASLARKVIAECRRGGRPVYVDPRGKDYAKYAGAT
ncbi:MAG: bifunctional heptose 7-phosphate kinase/heptose 1-phosphate adenyltransferase, partial [bacterium]|nr:bifunctional heptose 7-phosphate kinase/heptose 1-phosphate adenyltransferase [Candidatus Colisoma equi]